MIRKKPVERVQFDLSHVGTRFGIGKERFGPISKNEAEQWRREAIVYGDVLHDIYASWSKFFGAISGLGTLLSIVVIFPAFLDREWRALVLFVGISVTFMIPTLILKERAFRVQWRLDPRIKRPEDLFGSKESPADPL
jgi:hypothetical protein